MAKRRFQSGHSVGIGGRISHGFAGRSGRNPSFLPGRAGRAGGSAGPRSSNLWNDIFKMIPDVNTKRIMKDAYSEDALMAKARKAARDTLDWGGFGARNIAKSAKHTPKDTGALIKSIGWERAKITGGIVSGKLYAGVFYAEKNELRNRTKPFYLLRALQAMVPYWNAVLGGPRSIIIQLLPGQVNTNLNPQALFTGAITPVAVGGAINIIPKHLGYRSTASGKFVGKFVNKLAL